MKRTSLVLVLILVPCLVYADVTMTMKMKVSGMMGMVNSDWNAKVYSKADRLRSESVGKVIGMGGMSQAFDQVEIVRFDKGLVWLINNKDSTYSETKIDEAVEKEAALDVSIKDVKVNRTDNKRTIAGYECREVKVEFTLVLKAEESTMEHDTKCTLWVAKEDDKLKEVNRVWERGLRSVGESKNARFDAIYRQMETVLKEVGGVVLASEIVMEMGMGKMDQGEQQEYKQAMEMMRNLMKEQGGGKHAVGETEESSGGMKIASEVTSISFGKISDSLFELPKAYKKLE